MPLSREGKERSFRENLILAHTLPGVAGIVNVIGYLQLGWFTSHVTGRVSGFGMNVVKEKYTDAFYLLGLVATFVFGAMMASALIELAKVKHWPRFQLPLLIEAFLLSVILSLETSTNVPVSELPAADKIIFALAVSTSMGLQNALVARLSGAVIRTTHLTGVSTDLGIELVRVIRWFLTLSKDKSMSETVRHLAEVRKDAQLYRVRLYLTIFFTFMAGCVLGSYLNAIAGAFGMIVPVFILVALVAYDRMAGVSEEDLGDDYNPKFDEKKAEAEAAAGAATAVASESKT
ncbi:MAG: DUF1275 domain-containing protein [Myxococcaceae bacterium]|nr:DUF1275 domain-containing protein [Myxococcaceae bacterium]